MIGFLKGTVIDKSLDNLILNIKGVGYQIYTPSFVISETNLKDKKTLYIYTHVKEDEISLFGFDSKDDKQIFKNLISISGIGPKTALNIISYANGSVNIIKAIRRADVDFFDSIKGIAKKTSQRIIVDLKPKIGGLKDIDFETEADRDLIDALFGLGYTKEEINKAIKGIKKDLSLEEKIKLALKKNK